MNLPFSLAEITSYIGIVALLVMFPGPNTVLVMQSVAVSGRRAGFYNVMGIVTSVYCNALISGLGLSVIIMQSTQVYSLLKLAGACYIAYLGVVSLIDAYRLNKEDGAADIGEVAGEVSAAVPGSGMACYIKGVLTGILNPKAALFFLAFFPQFLHSDGNVVTQTVFLTVLYSLVSATWYCSMVLFVGTIRHMLTRRETQKWLKAVTGTLLVGMGLRIAVQR